MKRPTKQKAEEAVKLLLDYIVSDPAQLDMERVSTRISNGTNELFRNTNSGTNNEEAKKKIESLQIKFIKCIFFIPLFQNTINSFALSYLLIT